MYERCCTELLLISSYRNSFMLFLKTSRGRFGAFACTFKIHLFKLCTTHHWSRFPPQIRVLFWFVFENVLTFATIASLSLDLLKRIENCSKKSCVSSLNRMKASCLCVLYFKCSGRWSLDEHLPFPMMFIANGGLPLVCCHFDWFHRTTFAFFEIDFHLYLDKNLLDYSENYLSMVVY